MVDTRMTNSAPGHGRGVLLGIALLAGLIGPQIYWLIIGYENVADLNKAMWAFYTGAVFAFAKSQKGKCFLFDGMLWTLRSVHFPRSEMFAYLYAAAFTILGFYYLHNWSHAVSS